MEKNNVALILETYRGKIPAEGLIALKNALESSEGDVALALSYVKLTDPTMVLIMSIFLGGFGVDRFIVGDVGLGILKILFAWATCGIWWLVDIFKTPAKAKQQNLQKLLLAISLA